MTGMTTDTATFCGEDTARDDSDSASAEVISSICGMLRVLQRQPEVRLSLRPQPTIAANYSILVAENSSK